MLIIFFFWFVTSMETEIYNESIWKYRFKWNFCWFPRAVANIFAHQEYNITRNSMITCDWHHHNYAKFCIYHLVRNFKNLIQALWKCYKLKVKSRLLFEYNVNLPSTTIITVCNFKPTFSKIISLHLKSTKNVFIQPRFLILSMKHWT